MTSSPGAHPVPDAASVVQVYGSTFLLEWLDLDVLASAAALHLAQAAALEGPAQPDEGDRVAPAA